MNNFCDHFLTLKQQKVANFIKKSTFKCNNYKHVDTQFTLCLHCGQTRCNSPSNNPKQSNSQENSCSKLHFQSSKHPLVLKLLSCYVYCYICQLQIQSTLQQEYSQGSNLKNKVEKASALYEKIRELAIRNLPNIYSQRKNGNPKNNKKQDKSELKNQNQVKITNTQSVKSKIQQLRVFGLSNIGNTCYFNSVLQCLFATQQLHSFYQDRYFKDDLNITFKKFLNNSQKVYNPKNIFGLLSKGHKFLKSMDQQDAFQLFVLLTDTLIQSAAHSNPKISFKEKIQMSVGKIFGFNCANRLECLSCGKISWNQDFNLGLTIPLSKPAQKKVQIPTNEQIPQKQIGETRLYYPDGSVSNNFLDNYFTPQILSKPNSYKCENCAQSTATHKMYIKSPPQVLSINFKRFNNSGAKVNTYVNIPPQISLNPHCIRRGNYTYQLYAGAVHSGSSRGGHYVAYTKRSNNWYYFSDSHFKPASLTSLKQAHPYIIFYRRLHEYDEQQEDTLAQKNNQDNFTEEGDKQSNIQWKTKEKLCKNNLQQLLTNMSRKQRQNGCEQKQQS